MRCRPYTAEEPAPNVLRVAFSLVGLPGLEPGASSFRVLHPGLIPQDRTSTCANDVPLETSTNRSNPMACGPKWTKPGEGGPDPHRRWRRAESPAQVEVSVAVGRESVQRRPASRTSAG